ncbi:hypothetical protein NQ317_012056 [Molorchus minor]|uniref:CS domain-containing protein n=1 Tax=Molorchus minor TaxID=1323400 RepID=A0ABQ9K5C1_9CUCU|nr:hypothetical protein NQ317_012056 [Molorchus minor]
MTEQPLPPPVMWAQRSAVVFLTINLEDVKDPQIKFTKDSVYFKGTGGVEKKNYEVTIPLYKEIDPEKKQKLQQGEVYRNIISQSKPRGALLALPYCDFNKWHDEDDSGDEGLGGMGGGDFEDMMRQMGGLGAGGGKPNFDDLDVDEGGDSDDEPIPDLE